MPDLEPQKTVQLLKPISTNDGKQTWTEITLKEPVLMNVMQFYDRQKSKGSLDAMALLFSLTAANPISETDLKKMTFRDYKECESYMIGFLNYSPDSAMTPEDGKNSPQI